MLLYIPSADFFSLMGFRLLRATATVGSMTALSRVFGLLRDIVLARLFGASTGMDAFLVAFRIPNFFRRLFAEGAFTQAFVPVLAEYREQRRDEEVQALLDQIFATLSLVLSLFTVIGILSAPLVISLFAPGFLGSEDPRQVLATELLRITFPYLLFISLTAFAAGILNTWRHFAIPAFTPVLLNLSLIACAIFLAPHMAKPVTALAWGVFIAGIAQLLLQVPFLVRLGKLPRLRWRADRAGGRHVFRLLVPALYGASIVQINLLVDTFMASFLITGSISWLYFSDRLMEFPLGVFGIALATVILPQLAREYARATMGHFASVLRWGLRWVWLVALPASVGLILLAEPLLFTFFQYDQFRTTDVHMAARSLIAYAAGLVAFMLIKILAAAFFSRQQMSPPVRVATVAMIANIVLNIALIGPLAHAGLALATTLSAALQAFLLFILLYRLGLIALTRNSGIFFVRLGFSCLILTLFLWFLRGDFWSEWDLLQRLGNILWLVTGGIGVYAVALYGSGMRLCHLQLRDE